MIFDSLTSNCNSKPVKFALALSCLSLALWILVAAQVLTPYRLRVCFSAKSLKSGRRQHQETERGRTKNPSECEVTSAIPAYSTYLWLQ